MATKQRPTVLQVYTEALEALSAFKEKHKPIFEALEALEASVALTREDLVLYARRVGNIENDKVMVKVIKAFKKSYDFDAIMAAASESEKMIIDEKCIERVVNKAAFETLVKENVLSPQLRATGYREEEITPRVMITVKGEQGND